MSVSSILRSTPSNAYGSHAVWGFSDERRFDGLPYILAEKNSKMRTVGSFESDH
jgi:hypothetical protein